MKLQRNHLTKVILTFLVFNSPSFANVGGISGSSIISVAAGTASAPTYKILSASIPGASVYTGTIYSIDNDNNVTFSTTLDDSNNTINPFVSGSFNKNAQVPAITSPAPSAGAIPNSFSSSNIVYGDDGFDTNGEGFTNAPRIIISSSDGGGTTAEVTSSINANGEITAISVTEGGTNYSSTPGVQVVGGPHLLRIIDSESPFNGRVFLIQNNTATTLNLDLSLVASGETATASYFFNDDASDNNGTLVEVVPAATLGRVFGQKLSNLPTNWTKASTFMDRNSADWVYIWDPSLAGYGTFYFMQGTSSWKDGWKGISSRRDSMNNFVIYPDESIIIAKRTSGAVEFNLDSSVSSNDQRIYLPAEDDQMLCNNPYGIDLYLAELIPSTAIGSSGAGKFRSGASATDTDADYVTILSGSQWQKFWYKENENDSITSMMVAGTRAGSGGSNGLQASDLFIGSGSVSGLTSWQNSSSEGSVTGNDANYTFISASGTLPEAGFTVTLSGINGRMLNDSGTSEVNASSGEDVASGSGTEILSNLNAEYLVVHKSSSPAGFVIEKQRDCNYTSGGTWSVGSLGAGYSSSIDAKWWALGGGGSGAYGTVDNAGSFTVTSAGSGYTQAPQLVISGSGWRYSTEVTSEGNQTIGATDGIILTRRADSGVASFIDPVNPNK